MKHMKTGLSLLLICLMLLAMAPVSQAEEGVWVVSPENELDFAVLLSDPSWAVTSHAENMYYLFMAPNKRSLVKVFTVDYPSKVTKTTMDILLDGTGMLLYSSYQGEIQFTDYYDASIGSFLGRGVDYSGAVYGSRVCLGQGNRMYILQLEAVSSGLAEGKAVFDTMYSTLCSAAAYREAQQAAAAPTATPAPTAAPTALPATESPAAHVSEPTSAAVDLSALAGEWVVSPQEEHDFAVLLTDAGWTYGNHPDAQLFAFEAPQGFARIYISKIDFGFAATADTMQKLLLHMVQILEEDNGALNCSELYAVTVDSFPGQAVDHTGSVFGTCIYFSTPTSLYSIQLLSDEAEYEHAREIFDVMLLSFRTAAEYEADPPQPKEPEAADGKAAAGQTEGQPEESGPSQMSLSDAKSALERFTLRTDYVSTRIDNSMEFPTTLYLDESGKLLYSVWNNVYGDTVTPCRQDWYYDEQGRTVASVSYENGIMMVIHLYDYDAQGNMTVHHYMIEGAWEALIASYHH